MNKPVLPPLPPNFSNNGKVEIPSNSNLQPPVPVSSQAESTPEPLIDPVETGPKPEALEVPSSLSERPSLTSLTSASSLGIGNEDDGTFDSESDVFEDVPRTLVVNEQPFFRWLQRVALALLVASIFTVVISVLSKVPLEFALISVASVWIIILAITAPEAIIPYKKTTFNIAEDTVRVGQKKPRPLSEITRGSLTMNEKNAKLWLSFNENEKDGFFVPLKSNKFSMKYEDLLALRTIVPHTSLKELQEPAPVEGKSLPISKGSLEDLIEDMIDNLKR